MKKIFLECEVSDRNYEWLLRYARSRVIAKRVIRGIIAIWEIEGDFYGQEHEITFSKLYVEEVDGPMCTGFVLEEER